MVPLVFPAQRQTLLPAVAFLSPALVFLAGHLEPPVVVVAVAVVESVRAGRLMALCLRLTAPCLRSCQAFQAGPVAPAAKPTPRRSGCRQRSSDRAEAFRATSLRQRHAQRLGARRRCLDRSSR